LILISENLLHFTVQIKCFNKILFQEPNSSFHGQKGKDNLFAGVINLFVGGSETTSNTLNWALFHLSKNLELQSRAVAEIQKVVGKNRLPSLEYRPEMPLVEAIVMETHRMSALAYSGIPRQVVKDTTLGEFFLPKVRFLWLFYKLRLYYSNILCVILKGIIELYWR
jgi:hypothetical protein